MKAVLPRAAPNKSSLFEGVYEYSHLCHSVVAFYSRESYVACSILLIYLSAQKCSLSFKSSYFLVFPFPLNERLEKQGAIVLCIALK